MKWIVTVPLIIETADGMSREQVMAELVRQNIIRGAADMFTLEPIVEAFCDECNAPNGAAKEVEKEDGLTETTAEN